MAYKYRTDSVEETEELGRKIGEKLRKGDVIAFRGGLGAGKTAMTRGIALGMGIRDGVSSPTFALVNEYGGEPKLCHFDMYRISGEADLESTGFFDYLDDGCVIAVEWSENIAELLPKNATTVDIAVLSENSREITVYGDERFDF